MSKSITISGAVQSVNLRRFKPYSVSPYSRSEEYAWKLEVELLADDGRVVFFRSPAVRQTITLGGPVAVVCFHFGGSRPPTTKNEDGTYNHPAEDAWVREVGENRVASAGQPNDNVLESKLGQGDQLTIKCRVKTESDRGARRVVNYVQLVSHEPAKEVQA